MTTETAEVQQDSDASLQAAFTQGFATARSEEPPAPAEAPAAQTEQKAETPPAEAQAAEATPPAEATPKEDLESRVKQLEAMLGDVTHRARSAEGRVGSLQRQIESLTKEQAATPPPPPPKPATERLKVDYPELGPAVQAAIDEALDTAQGKQSSTLTQDQVREIVSQAMAPFEVEMHHKGWRQTVASPEFKFWMATAGSEAETLSKSKSSADAIKLLNMYVASAQRKTADPPPSPPPPDNPGRRKLEAAQAVGTGARAETSPTALSDEAAFHSGFNSARQGR